MDVSEVSSAWLGYELPKLGVAGSNPALRIFVKKIISNVKKLIFHCISRLDILFDNFSAFNDRGKQFLCINSSNLFFYIVKVQIIAFSTQGSMSFYNFEPIQFD